MTVCYLWLCHARLMLVTVPGVVSDSVPVASCWSAACNQTVGVLTMLTHGLQLLTPTPAACSGTTFPVPGSCSA